MRHEVYIILTSIYGPGSFATHLFDVTHFFFFLLHALWMVLAALFIAAVAAPNDGIDGIASPPVEKSDLLLLPRAGLRSSASSVEPVPEKTEGRAREGCVGTARAAPPCVSSRGEGSAERDKSSARFVSRFARSYASLASSSAARHDAGSGLGSAYRSYDGSRPCACVVRPSRRAAKIGEAFF